MLRSITVRLILAFLLVGITVVALASGITYGLTVREFRQLTYDQARDRFVADMTFFYQTHGSWDGVLAYYQERSAIHTPFNPQQGGRPGPGGGDGSLQTIIFGLADQNGRVVMPTRGMQIGNLLPQATLDQGAPITVGDSRVGTAIFAGNLPPFGGLEERYLSRTNLGLLYAALGASAVALILGIVLARSLTRPIRALTAATRAMATGKLKQNVQVKSNDELGELAAAFNQMSADVDRLLMARRQMTADIAHDLRNPLTVVGGYVESMQDGVLKPTPERLAAMQSEVQHLQRLVEDLRLLSQADAGELLLNREPLAVAALLGRVAQSYGPLAEKQGVTLRSEAPAALPEVRADAERLARVLGNLVSNSLRYTPAGGEIVLKAKAAQAGWVEMCVADNGLGIAPEALPYVFDRLYRADPARAAAGSGEESGLGLAIARSIVEAHGGSIAAQSGAGKGTIMTIRLPVYVGER